MEISDTGKLNDLTVNNEKLSSKLYTKLMKQRTLMGLFQGSRSAQALQTSHKVSTPSPQKRSWIGLKEVNSEESEGDWSLSDTNEIQESQKTLMSTSLCSKSPLNPKVQEILSRSVPGSPQIQPKSSNKRTRFPKEIFNFIRKPCDSDLVNNELKDVRSSAVQSSSEKISTPDAEEGEEKAVILISSGGTRRVGFPPQQLLTTSLLKLVFNLIFTSPSSQNDDTQSHYNQNLYMLDCNRQEFVQLSNTDIIPSDSVILCEYLNKSNNCISKSSCQCSSLDSVLSKSVTNTISQSFSGSDMSKNRVVMDQATSSASTVPRQNSPQHKICLPRNKVLQTAKTITSTSQQPLQIPIYLTEAQLAMLNSKHSLKDVPRQLNAEATKSPNTAAKVGTNPALISSALQQQQQQLLAQHLHQHQTHNYLNHVALGGNNENTVHNQDHSTSNQSSNAVSYLIPPNLLVSHNQLSQLHPRDLAIIQQKLLHQQHLYQHQQQMQSGSVSNQHLMCTCPSELHRAIHVQQQQQQAQKLFEQRKLLAAQLSSIHAGQPIKITPVAATTLPRDQHSATHHIHMGKLDLQTQMSAASQPHMCHNHQLNFQRQVDSVDNANAFVITSGDPTETQSKDGHTCVLNSSADSGYSSNKEPSISDTDSQISNVLLWVESVYGVKIIDYLLKNYSQQIQLASKNCCEKPSEINGNELFNNPDTRKIRHMISEQRKELEDVKMLLKCQYEFFRESVNQVSGLIQMPDSQKISDRIKLFEYNQAVLAHKIQTVQTSVSTYFSSDEKYQPDVLSNLSRNVSDINEDFSKLQESYMLIEKPVKVNIELVNQNLEKYQNILMISNKGLIMSQNQLNNLNITMTDLIRKQSLIKAQRKIATLPEEALESVIALKEELHRDLLALTPDLEKRQSACEILEKILFEKFDSCRCSEISGTFEEIVDANLSGVDDTTPTGDESPTFINSNEISSINTDDDSLPPPPSIDVSDESPIPINISDNISHIEMVTDSIPMIDETPSSESFDDVCFQPTFILVKQNAFQKWTQPENVDSKDEVVIEPKSVQKTGTILKTGTSQFPVGSKSSRTNKVVFCNTVTVEDGSETIRLNCPSEESDCEEQLDSGSFVDDQGTIRKNPPPPPPRRTSQISSGVDAIDGEINYENLESFSSDMRHHILHHNLVCIPLTVKTPAGSQANTNHSNEHSEKRRIEGTSMKQGKLKSLPCPSENDVWQRQTEFNTPPSRSLLPANKVNQKSSPADNSKPKIDKSSKKK